jgi:hypothetical protein
MEFTPEMHERLFVPGKGMPFYVDERSPELEDPSRASADHLWQPACGTTSRLVRCLEAIRDISTAVAPLSALPHPDADKRLVKQVIIPVYNLALGIRDLFNSVQSTRWTKLDKQKQTKLVRRFRQFGEAVPTKTGALKTARDKIAAHLDKDTPTWQYRQFWDSFGLADVLGWIRGCMRMLSILIPPDIYSWTRPSGFTNVVNLMNVDGTEVSLLMKEEEPDALVGLWFVISPKAGIVREARELASACCALEQRLGIGEAPAEGDEHR